MISKCDERGVRIVEPAKLKFVDLVFEGVEPFLTFYANDGNGENIKIGKLWGTGGKLSFEGNAEKSAEIFFNGIIDEYRKHLGED